MSAADVPEPGPNDKPIRTRRLSTKKRPWSGKLPAFHPKQRIFLSIDAIGSTSLKSSLADKGCTPDMWANSFLAFLPEVAIVYWGKFVEMVNRHCPRDKCKCPCVPADIKSNAKPPSLDAAAKVWKYIGDEVVLVADLTCKEHHASLHILALAETLKHFNADFAKKNDPDNKLRFKGTAWVAAFPVTNIEIELPGSTKDHPVKDFLGPSIDLGFRLAKFSSEERLVVSASLAHLIVSAPAMKVPIVSYMDKEEPSLPLCFGGTIEAKGIKNGKHPLIWYSINETRESVLCRVEKEDLLTFLKNEHFSTQAILPFVLDDRHSDPDYDAAYIKAVAEQKKIPYSIFCKKKRVRKASETITPLTSLDATNVIKRIPPA